jgi:hypothetical protein
VEITDKNGETIEYINATKDGGDWFIVIPSAYMLVGVKYNIRLVWGGNSYYTIRVNSINEIVDTHIYLDNLELQEVDINFSTRIQESSDNTWIDPESRNVYQLNYNNKIINLGVLSGNAESAIEKDVEIISKNPDRTFTTYRDQSLQIFDANFVLRQQEDTDKVYRLTDTTYYTNTDRWLVRNGTMTKEAFGYDGIPTATRFGYTHLHDESLDRIVLFDEVKRELEYGGDRNNDLQGVYATIMGLDGNPLLLTHNSIYHFNTTHGIYTKLFDVERYMIGYVKLTNAILLKNIDNKTFILKHY